MLVGEEVSLRLDALDKHLAERGVVVKPAAASASGETAGPAKVIHGSLVIKPEPAGAGGSAHIKGDQETAARKMLQKQVTDFKKVNWRKLKGKPCDPEEPLLVILYNRPREAMRRQLLKRHKLLNRTVIYEGLDGQKHIGKIVAFYHETGDPAIYCKDSVEIKQGTQILILED